MTISRRAAGTANVSGTAIPMNVESMSDRDQLAWLSHRACGCDGACPPDAEDYKTADAIIAAGWRAPSDTVIDIGYVFGEQPPEIADGSAVADRDPAGQ